MKIEEEKQVRVKNTILKKGESESKHIKMKEEKSKSEELIIEDR